MYLEHYGLKEPPFSITPDPRFVFLSERHRDALAHLLYGIGQGGGGGFVQLTGEVGTGKTTLCRLLLEQLPENTRVALVLNPKVSPLELLETICEELKLDIDGRQGSLKGMVDVLNAYLLDAYAQGLRVVLIIDEAQNLSDEALEQVRLLTNLETPTQKLLQIILLGQPELREVLGKAELRQLAQRITARYHLTPLSEEETEAYVRHRLAVAGAQRFPFTKLALRRIHLHSGGVPRLINVIADRALVAGYAQDLAQVGERAVDQAAKEALASPIQRLRVPRLRWLGVAALLLAAVALWWFTASEPPSPEPSADAAGEEIETGTDAMGTPDVGSQGLERRILDAGPSGLNAWTRLLSLWMLRAEVADVRTAARCPLVLGPGVFCLRGSGSLTKLATLRRPVILRLSEGGREAWAVLLGIDEDSVRLAIGGDTFDTGWHELERAWLGEFYAVWRAPPFMAGTFRRGDSGPAVEWLEQALAAANGRETAGPQGPAYYDGQMESEVRSLQAAHGLIPDGIVGPETLLALSSHTPGGPRLRRRLD